MIIRKKAAFWAVALSFVTSTTPVWADGCDLFHEQLAIESAAAHRMESVWNQGIKKISASTLAALCADEKSMIQAGRRAETLAHECFDLQKSNRFKVDMEKNMKDHITGASEYHCAIK